MNNLDDLLNNHGFTISPLWIAQAVWRKDPHMTIGLANSRLYKLNHLDRALATTPLAEQLVIQPN